MKIWQKDRMKKFSRSDREGNKKLYQTAKKIKQEVAHSLLNETPFKDDDDNVLYYTG